MLYSKPYPRVSIVTIENENFYDALNRGISLLGFVDFDGPISIKPNLCDLIPSNMGVTTDVRAIAALIKIIREKSDSQISIVESNHWIATADEEFEKLGYKELEKEFDIKLVNLSKEKKTTIRIDGNYFTTFRCPKTLLESRLISVSKMKTHHQYRFTGILKNQFGLIPGRIKSRYHPFMSEVLADLNGTFKPFLSIIDGLVSMEGAGPSEGEPIITNVIICGTDPVAVDYVAAKTIGINPRTIGYLKYAEKKGVGEYNNVEIVGDKVQFYFKFLPFPTYILSRLSIIFLRIGNKMNTFFKNISGLLDQGFMATITIRKGFHTSFNYGSVTPKSIIKYAKALIRRSFYRITHV